VHHHRQRASEFHLFVQEGVVSLGELGVLAREWLFSLGGEIFWTDGGGAASLRFNFK